MSRNMLNYTLENIRGELQKQTVTKLSISPEMMLEICLYKLTRGDYHYTTGDIASRAQYTIVCCFVIKVSELITEMLWEEHVEKLFPNTVEEFKTAMVNMESEWQFLFVFSAIDGSHLPIKCPKRGSEAMKQY